MDTKKFSVEKILDFQMIDDKPIIDQVHEFENIVYELRLKGVEVNETLLVTSLIKKLSFLGMNLLKCYWIKEDYSNDKK